MNAKEYRVAIEKLGLSQHRAAAFFGYSPRQGQRFAAGDRKIPICVAYLISEMLRNKTMPDDLEKRFAKNR